jgi:hypothetical protein
MAMVTGLGDHARYPPGLARCASYLYRAEVHVGARGPGKARSDSR